MSDDDREPFCVNSNDSQAIAKKAFDMILSKLGLDDNSHELSELEVAKLGGTMTLVGDMLTGFGKKMLDRAGYKEAEAPGDSD